MAEGTKLVLVFETVNDTKTVFTFPYAKPSVETSAVKTLINTIIANNDILRTLLSVVLAQRLLPQVRILLTYQNDVVNYPRL